MPGIKILSTDVFYAFSDLDSVQDYGTDEVPPIILKNWSVFSNSINPHLSFILEVCLHSTYPMEWWPL